MSITALIRRTVILAGLASMAAAVTLALWPASVLAPTPTPGSIDPWMPPLTMKHFSCGSFLFPQDPHTPHYAGDETSGPHYSHRCAQLRDHRMDQSFVLAAGGTLLGAAGSTTANRRRRQGGDLAVSPA